jgi:hypothetical protein
VSFYWVCFYWGVTIEEYEKQDDISSAILRAWLVYFKEKGKEITATSGENPEQSSGPAKQSDVKGRS